MLVSEQLYNIGSHVLFSTAWLEVRTERALCECLLSFEPVVESVHLAELVKRRATGDHGAEDVEREVAARVDGVGFSRMKHK